MVSVALGAEEVEARLGQWDGRLGLAAVNGPGSVVVSGEREALDGFLAELVEGGVRAREIPVGYASHSSQIEEIREELLDACAGVVPRSGGVPFYSTVTGGLLDTGELDAGYWYRNLRETVRFDAVTRVLLGEGRRVFVEVGPHPVLSVAVQETVDEVLGDPDGAVVVGSLRREEGGAERFVSSLAEVWVRGVDVDWAGVIGGSAQRVPLPTYAFQRERYWLAGGSSAGDVSCAGLVSAGHPLLGAAVGLAGGDEWLFTGRISLESHPWLADHVVMGVTLVPGTAFLELALYAGSQLGCELVQELTFETPLVLGGGGAVQLQVSVGEPDQSGARSLGVYSRPQDPFAEGVSSEQEWTRHASGLLAPHDALAGERAAVEDQAAALAGVSWPPQGAVAVDIDDFYGRVADVGFDYGPAFSGLRAAWRRGNEVFAEAALSEDQRREAETFGLHPALLDAALQVASVWLFGQTAEQQKLGVHVPFSFGRVSLRTAGVSSLRVGMSFAGLEGSAGMGDSSDGGGVSLVVADDTGELVTSLDLVVRGISAKDLAGARGAPESLFAVRWTPVAIGSSGPSAEVYDDLESLRKVVEGGGAVPAVVLVDLTADGLEVLESVHKVAHRALELVQRWLSDERFAGSKLVLMTKGAVAVNPEEGVVGLAQSPVWGLVRSAQSESPERLVLVDIDDDQASLGALGGALALGESQLAVREGGVFVPRLARAGAPPDDDATGIDAESTVLVTGGTGVLGGLVARHLVSEHGVGHLLLVGRRGLEGQGASELQVELESLGANVRVAACDVADREQLEVLLGSIPQEHPLGGVVHAAGVLDDGVIGSLTAERLDGVLAPKADAAWYLHELTESLDLSMFVLFSSAAGTLGSPGQGGYAAANAFLDALAAHRRARGLAGSSLAWGLWEQVSGLTGALSEADRSRIARSGIGVLSSQEGLELFDRALSGSEASLLPVPLDLAALRAQARAGILPALFAGLVRVPTRRSRDADGSLLRRLGGTPEADREGVVLEIVRGYIAAVLGHASPQAIDPESAFKDLGFDSLAAVELRNRLGAATGLRLPATLVFDYPTPAALSAYLVSEVGTDTKGSAAEEPTETLTSLFQRARDLGAVVKFMGMVAMASEFRPAFTEPLVADGAPKPVRLAEGAAHPRLVCFPSVVAMSGPHEYAGFAESFRGTRDVLALPLPGFAKRDLLPATMRVAMETQAEAVRRCAAGAPIVLVGHSSGGLFAHGVASHLEGIGEAPAAVILIDAFSFQDQVDPIKILDQTLGTQEIPIAVNDVRLTAMGAYLRLLASWEPPEIKTPTLLVRPTEPMPGMASEREWRSVWHLPHTTVDVPGDHLTMMGEHAESTAQAVEIWLSTALDA
jgi:acyl transferase domain-containing protein/acyl carrier protein